MTGIYTNALYDQVALTRKQRKQRRSAAGNTLTRRPAADISIPKLWAIALKEKSTGKKVLSSRSDCSFKKRDNGLVRCVPDGNARPVRAYTPDMLKLAALVLIPAALSILYLGKCAGAF